MSCPELGRGDPNFLQSVRVPYRRGSLLADGIGASLAVPRPVSPCLAWVCAATEDQACFLSEIAQRASAASPASVRAPIVV